MLETNTNNNNNKISIADRFVNEGSIAILLCTIIITVYVTYYDIKYLLGLVYFLLWSAVLGVYLLTWAMVQLGMLERFDYFCKTQTYNNSNIFISYSNCSICVYRRSSFCFWCWYCLSLLDCLVFH